MVCLNLHDAAGFVLRQAKGPQLKLDFGRKLKTPPNGLKGSQLVEVMGTLVPGGQPLTQWCYIYICTLRIMWYSDDAHTWQRLNV